MELSPHPALLVALSSTDAGALSVGSLQRDAGGLSSLYRSLSTLHVSGWPVDWERALGGRSAHWAELPTYPFRGERFWRGARSGTTVEEATDCSYEVSWTPLALDLVRERSGSVLWIVSGAAGSAWAEALHAAANMAGRSSRLGSVSAYLEDDRLQIAEEVSADLVLIAELTDPEQSLVTAVQALQKALRTGRGRVWVMTRAALPVVPGEAVAQPWDHMLWGLGRCLGIERGECWGGLLDLPRSVSQDGAERVLGLLGSDCEQGDEFALRNGQILGRRLTRWVPQSAQFPWRTSGTALVTGGTGTLGKEVARWLVSRGTQHVVLTSRRGMAAVGSEQLLSELAAAGVTAEVVACDLSQRVEVETLLSRLKITRLPLRSVVHAAGVGEELAFERLDALTVRRVLAGKVLGARWLDELLGDVALDAFVLYGSISGLWGAPGYAAYAAANAGLVGLAHHRRARGRVATAIHWGPWAAGGMLDDALGESLRRQGLTAISSRVALGALEAALLPSSPAELAVVDVDFSTFAPAFALGAPRRALLREIPEARHGLQNSSVNTSSPAIPSLDLREARARVFEALRSALGLPEGFVCSPATSPLDLGLNSVRAVELARVLRTRLGVQVAASAVLQAASIEELVERALARAIPSESRALDPRGLQTLRAPGGGEMGAWLVPIQQPAEPKLRLLCFAYAGGGAAVYASWRGLLPDDVEILAVELPGRGRRAHEPHVRSAVEIVEAVANALHERADLPLMVFGHCLGAILAFEFCCTSVARGPRVQHLFVSGAPAPHLYSTTSMAMRTDAQLIEMLEEIGLEGVRAMQQDPAFMQVALRIVRADMALAETYDCASTSCLPLPITAFSANADGFASVASVDAWRAYARGMPHFQHYQYAGGHYFIEGERESILSVLSEVMLAQRAEHTAQPRLLSDMSDRQRPLAVILTGGAQVPADFAPLIHATRAEADLDFLLLELPGHDGRGLPMRRLEPMAELLELELSTIRAPLVLIGHGFPAHVALAVARRRLARGLPVCRLVASCAVAPARYCMPPWRLPACERLLAPHTRERLRRDPSLAPRVDAELSAAFHYRPGVELAGCIELAVTAILAADDESVPPAAVSAWRQVTHGPFRLLRVSGGNMYYSSQPSLLARALLDPAHGARERFLHEPAREPPTQLPSWVDLDHG